MNHEVDFMNQLGHLFALRFRFVGLIVKVSYLALPTRHALVLIILPDCRSVLI